jgi:hypothetical protein
VVHGSDHRRSLTQAKKTGRIAGRGKIFLLEIFWVIGGVATPGLKKICRLTRDKSETCQASGGIAAWESPG